MKIQLAKLASLQYCGEILQTTVCTVEQAVVFMVNAVQH